MKISQWTSCYPQVWLYDSLKNSNLSLCILYELDSLRILCLWLYKDLLNRSFRPISGDPTCTAKEKIILIQSCYSASCRKKYSLTYVLILSCMILESSQTLYMCVHTASLLSLCLAFIQHYALGVNKSFPNSEEQ